MAVSSPDAKTSSTAEAKADKPKAPEGPKPVERGKAMRKDEIVPIGLVNRKEPYYALAKTNKDFLAQSVAEQYKLMKGIASRTPPGPLPPGMADFITNFERTNSGANADMNLEELKKFATAFIDIDSRHEAAAFKIAEWQLKILQVASGGVVDVVHDAQSEVAETPIYTIDREGRVDRVQGNRWTKLPQRILNALNPEQANHKWNQTVEAENKAARSSVDLQVVFFSESEQGEATLQLDRGIAGDMLTVAEQEFLRERMQIQAGLNRAQLTVNQTRTLRADLFQYVALRRDFYQQLGVENNRIGSSFIVRDDASPEGFRYADTINTLKVLTSERQAYDRTLNASGNLAAETQMIFQGLEKSYADQVAAERAANAKKVQDETQAEIKRQQGESHNQTMTNAAAQEAEYRKPIELTPAQIQQRDKLQGEITNTTNARDELVGLEQLSQGVDTLVAEQTALIAAGVPIANRNALETRRKDVDSLTNQIASAEAYIKAIVASDEYKNYSKEQEDARLFTKHRNEAIEKENKARLAKVPPDPVIPLEVPTYSAQSIKFLNDLQAQRTHLRNLDNQRNNARRDILDLEVIVNPRAADIKKFDELSAQINQASAQIDQLNIKYRITLGVRPTTADITAAKAAKEADLTTRQHDLDLIQAPDQQYRVIKAEALHEVQELLGGNDANGKQKLEAINERAQLVGMYNFDRSELTDAQIADVENNYDKVMLIYQRFPPVYIEALQILYGPQITQPGHEDQFRSASNLITPDVLAAILNPYVGGVIDNMYDLDYFDPALLARLTPRVVTDMVNHLRTQVNARTLGDVDATSRADRARIQTAAVLAPPLDATNAVVNTLANTYESNVYYYRDVTDLANQLMTLANSGVIVLPVFGGQESNAKAYAELLDSRKKAREQGLAP